MLWYENEYGIYARRESDLARNSGTKNASNKAQRVNKYCIREEKQIRREKSVTLWFVMYEIHKQSQWRCDSRFPENKFQSQFYRSYPSKFIEPSCPVSYYVISSLESYIVYLYWLFFEFRTRCETIQWNHTSFIEHSLEDSPPVRPF